MQRKLQPVSSFGLERLNNSDLKNIIMSVIINNNGLTFLYIHEKEEVAFEVFNSSPDNFPAIAEASASSGRSFSSVHLFFDNRFYTALPKGKINKSEKDSLAEMVFGHNHLEVVFQNQNDYDVIYGVEKEVFIAVSKLWKDAVLHHYAEAFYNSIKTTELNEDVFFEIRKDFFWAAMFKSNKLQLLNSYDFSGKEDFGYFSLGIIKNLGFNPKELNLWLSGNVQKDSPLEKLLSTYIKNIKPLDLKDISSEFISLIHIIKFFKK